jgi:tetratricopeptide (TPR) repeat protein
MALLGSLRSRRLAARAARLLADDGFAAAERLLDGEPALAGGAWAHFAVQLYNQDRKSEAEQAIRKALAIEPERGDALNFLAELLAESGREEEAIAVYRRLLVKYPAAMAEALALARLLAGQGDFGGARDLLVPFRQQATHELRMLLAKVHYELPSPARATSPSRPARSRSCWT